MNDARSWEYVGFWKRCIASIVDTLLLLAITLPILYLTYGSVYWGSGKAINGLVDILMTYVFPAIAVIWLWRRFGSTPGKMMFQARIVDAVTGDAPSTGQLVGRYFGYFVSTLPLCLGLIWVAFDARKQGWHDKLAGTVVIRTTQADNTPTTFQPRA